MNSMKKGFTLIELVVTMVLMSIVSAILFGIINYQHITYNNIEEKADVQRNVRLISTYLDNNLRYATEFELLENKPTSFDNNYIYIYYDNEDENIYINNKGVTTALTTLGLSHLSANNGGIRTDADKSKHIKLKFRKPIDKNYIEYSISGKTNINIKSSLKFQNIDVTNVDFSVDDTDFNDINNTKYSCVKFKIPDLK